MINNRKAMARLGWMLLAAPAHNTLAQTDDEAFLTGVYGSAEMVSIATGTPQTLREIPAIATVITDEDIKATGATELAEVLETVPGLHVSVSNVGYNPVVSIRGVHSTFNPQVLVMVNGISIKNVFDGQLGQSWGGMPVTGIERIEVIRGPGSALYGADAFSGVINIITKSRADVDGLTVGARGGSFDRGDGYLLWGGTPGGFETSIYAEKYTTDGSRRRIKADAQTTLDGLFGTAASLAPGPTELRRDITETRLDAARGHWRLRGGYHEAKDSGVGAGVASALDPKGRGDGRRISADVGYDNPAWRENLGLSATLSYYDVQNLADLQLFPPGSFGGAFPDGVRGQPDVYERHYRGEAAALYTGFSDHRLRVGSGYRTEDLYRVREKRNYELVDLGFGPMPVPLPGGLTDVSDIAAFVREEKRNIVYGFVQDEWAFLPDWTLTSGVRVDRYSDFGTAVNPRLALVWQTSYTLTTKALYGRAFRAPSFAELYNINNPANLGNSNLDPETVDTWELAMDWQARPGVRASVNTYYYRMRDVIRFTPDPAPQTSTTARNAGRQTGYGLEAEISWQALRRLRLSGNYGYQHSTDEAAHDDVGFAPTHDLYLRADWALDSTWHLNGQVNGAFDRRRGPGDTRAAVKDYATFDLTLRGEDLGDGWGLKLSGRNLLDADAREPSASALIPGDLPLPGRNFYVELSRQFD